MRDVAEKAVATFIAAADDSNVDVRDQVLQSFRIYAGKDLPGVVKSIADWLLSHKPSSTPEKQREVLLKSLLEVLKAHVGVGTLPAAATETVLKAALGDMLAVSELNSSWGLAATALFVHTCDLNPAGGMPMLIEAVPSSAGGTMPFYVLHALADFATTSPLRMAPHLKELLKRLVPLLGTVKQENPRMLFSRALRGIATAVIHLEKFHTRERHADPAAAPAEGEEGEEGAAAMGQEQLTPRSQACQYLRASSFSEVLNTATGHLVQEWSRISEQRVRGPVLAAITTLSATLDEDARVKLFPQVANLAAAGVKREKPGDLALVAEGCACMCEIGFGDTIRETIVQHADAMLTCIAQACTSILADKGHQESFSGPTHIALREFHRWAELIGAASVDAVVSFAAKNFDPKTAAAKDAGYRSAVVGILGHIVSRGHLTARLEPYKDHVIATLKIVLTDPDIRVKKALANAIIAMATNSNVAFMGQVGAKDLLRFLVRCAATPHDTENDSLEAALRDHCRTSLQVLCSSQEHLDEALTWPGIMEHISSYNNEPELLNVLPTVVRSVIPLAERVGQTEHFYVDFRVNVNMPPPGTLVALLAANAALLPPPANHDGRALQGVQQTLHAMEAIAPLLDEPFLHQHLDEVPTPIADLWLTTLPELRDVAARAKTPEEGVAPMTPVEWEDLITKLVSRTVAARPEAEWVESIASGALGILPVALAMPSTCEGDPDAIDCSYASGRRDDLFRALLAVAGAAFAKNPRRDLVVAGIDAALDSADPDRAAHRAGVARFLSTVATNKEYVDVVMERLAVLSRPPPEKKGFFASLVSKKSENEKVARKVTERSRAMAALGLCHCARRMPSAALSSRLEASIAPQLQQILSEVSDVTVKHLILSAFLFLEAPLKKLSGLSDVPQFKARDALLDLVVDTAGSMLKKAAGTAAGAGREACLAAAATATEVATMLITSLPQLPMPTASTDAITTFLGTTVVGCPILRPGEDAVSDDLCRRAVLLFGAMLDSSRRAQRPLGVDDALAIYYPSVMDVDGGRRLRGATIALGILKTYLSRTDAQLSGQDEEAEGFTPLGITSGIAMSAFGARVFDPEVPLRKLALDALTQVLKMHAISHPDAFDGVDAADVGGALNAAKEVITELKAIKLRVFAVDLTPAGNRVLVNKELSALNKSLCAIFVRVLPRPELFTAMLDSLLTTGMRDPFPDCLSTATIVLHGTIRGMGGLLSTTQAQEYVAKVVSSAELVLSRQGDAADTIESVLSSLFVSVRNLVKHHTEPCFEALVRKHPAPHGVPVIRAVQAIAADLALQKPLMNYCIDTILNLPVFDEKNVPAQGPLSACCCIGWISEVSKCEALLYEMRSTTLCVLALYCSSVHEHPDQAAQGQAGNATKLFISNTSSDVTKDRLERFDWRAFTAVGNGAFEAYIAGVAETVKYWSDEDNQGEDLTTDHDREYEFGGLVGDASGLMLPPSEPSATVVDIAEFLVPYADKPSFAHRRVAVAIVSRALLRNSLGDSSLVQCLVTCLLGRTGPDEQPPLRLESLCAFGKHGLLAHDSFEGGPELLRDFLPSVTTALLNNLDDDRNPQIALIAATIMEEVMFTNDKAHVQQGTIVNVMLKIKARFEHPDPNMRKACITLFAAILSLALEGTIDRQHPLQQAHQFFVVLLAHAQEDDEPTRIASRKAVTTALALMSAGLSPESRQAVARFADRSALTIDPEFPSASPALFDDTTLNEFGGMWVAHFPGRVSDLFTACMSYFENCPPQLRLASASVSAVVLKHLPAEEFSRTNAEQLCAALMRVARNSSSSSELRTRAVRALGSLPVA